MYQNNKGEYKKMKIKNIKNLKRHLKRIQACKEAIEWVGKKDLKTAWKECDNACWLNWYLRRLFQGSIVYKNANYVGVAESIYSPSRYTLGTAYDYFRDKVKLLKLKWYQKLLTELKSMIEIV
jgi:hypothetical protein